MLTRKHFELIAKSIWRSGYIKDKNKIRQQAKEDMRRLIASDLIGTFKHDNPNFDEKRFLDACGLHNC